MRGRLARGWSAALRVALALAGSGCASSPPRLPPGDPLELVSPEQLFQIGIELEDSDSIRAEQYLSAALSRGYPEAEVLPAILRVCVRASRFGDALDYAEPYLERHPDDWALQVLVASIHMGLGHPNDAHHRLTTALEVAPDEPSAHYLMAVLARDSLGDALVARGHFARYLELAPEGDHAAEARMELRRTDAAGMPAPTPVRLEPHSSDDADGEGEPAASPGAPEPTTAAPAPAGGSPSPP